jgi:hypothetical protein
MHRIYVEAGIIYLFLLLAAFIVAVFQVIRGTFSLKGTLLAIGGLSMSELGSYACMWGSFVLAGGPDGQFLHLETLSIGGGFIVFSLLAATFALYLLSIPCKLAFLYLSPPIITVAAQAAKVWPVTLFTFTTGPIICLFIIAGIWIVQVFIQKRERHESRI